MEYRLSKEDSERINILKLIGIVFVVFIHSYTPVVNFAGGSLTVQQPIWLDAIEYGVSQVIARCGVPMFFLISSILLFKKNREYFSTIRGKAKTLLVPYLFWNTAWIFVFFVLQSLPFTADYFSGSNTLIRDCGLVDWLNLYGIGNQYPQDYPLWFMRDLMVVTLFFPLIDFVTEKQPKIVLIASMLLLFLPLNFPFKDAVLWVCLGACVVKLSLRMSIVDNMPMSVIGLIYAGVAITLTCLHIYDIDFAPISTAFIFIGIIFWIKITQYIYANTSLRCIFLKLAEWTFIVYAAHEMTLSSIKKVCFKLLPNNSVIALILYFTIPFVVIALCVIFGRIMKRVLPATYRVVTGGR